MARNNSGYDLWDSNCKIGDIKVKRVYDRANELDGEFS